MAERWWSVAFSRVYVHLDARHANFDRAQLVYAWIFVAMRVVHTCVYIGWTYVPYRFASFVASSIVLGTIWLRLALQFYQ